MERSWKVALPAPPPLPVGMCAEFVTPQEYDSTSTSSLCLSSRDSPLMSPITDAYLVDNIAIDPARQGEGLGRQLMDHAVGEARRRRLSAIRLYTNAAMTENLSIYAHMGFVETHRAVEKGFNRIYLRWALPGGEE